MGVPRDFDRPTVHNLRAGLENLRREQLLLVRVAGEMLAVYGDLRVRGEERIVRRFEAGFVGGLVERSEALLGPLGEGRDGDVGRHTLNFE